MAAIDYYVSVPFRRVASGDLNNAGLHSGVTSSSSDYIELRMRVQDGSSVKTGLTKLDVYNALCVFDRWIIEGGLIGDGTNVPFAAS